MALLLVILITACPLICGAVEACQVAHRHDPASPASPNHCPEDSDNCICRGAVQASDTRLPDRDVVGLSSTLLLWGALAHSPAHSFLHLTTDGSPTGLAAWGDSLAVCAVLQNFRC